MVVIFMVPVLMGVGVGRCAPSAFYLTAIADRRAVLDDSGRGSARRARCSWSTCFRRGARVTC